MEGSSLDTSIFFLKRIPLQNYTLHPSGIIWLMLLAVKQINYLKGIYTSFFANYKRKTQSTFSVFIQKYECDIVEEMIELQLNFNLVNMQCLFYTRPFVKCVLI